MKKVLSILILSGLTAWSGVTPQDISANRLLQYEPTLGIGDVPVVTRPGRVGSGGSMTDLTNSIAAKQPLEDQRVSTTNDVAFASVKADEFKATATAGGTNYIAGLTWDATNKVFAVTETAE